VGVWRNADVGTGSEDIGSATIVIDSSSAGQYLGFSVSMRDDVDGDGQDDLLVGAPYSASTTAYGAAYLFMGVGSMSGSTTTASADATINGDSAAEHMGYQVVIVGDTTGDGTADVLVTADYDDAGASNAGAFYLYTSAPSGSVTGATTADAVCTGEVSNDYFGRAAGWAGDVNNDGFDDFMVSATAWDLGTITGTGAAYLFYGPVVGGSMSASTDYDLRLTGSNYSDAVGLTVGGGGDVDNDGFSDFMVSSTSWDSFGLLNAGAAWMYYGSGD
jgi:hypothetical protein